MKKVLLVALVLVMAIGMVACGKSEEVESVSDEYEINKEEWLDYTFNDISFLVNEDWLKGKSSDTTEVIEMSNKAALLLQTLSMGAFSEEEAKDIYIQAVTRDDAYTVLSDTKWTTGKYLDGHLINFASDDGEYKISTVVSAGDNLYAISILGSKEETDAGMDEYMYLVNSIREK